MNIFAKFQFLIFVLLLLLQLLVNLSAEMNKIAILLTQILMQYGIQTPISYGVNRKRSPELVVH
jgi:hypothetical protein